MSASVVHVGDSAVGVWHGVGNEGTREYSGMTLGERIRRIRNQRELTLERVARGTGLTTSFLSQVERDAVSPSVGSLQKMARVLGVKLGAFFEEDEREELTIVRKAEGLRSAEKQAGSTVETLASGLLNIKMEPKLITLDVRGEVSEVVSPNIQEAFGLVLEGKVDIVRGANERLRLAKGDSALLRNPRPYRIVNAHTGTSVMLWIAIVPSL